MVEKSLLSIFMITDVSKTYILSMFLGHIKPQENPVIHATCGIPGAGKTTFVNAKIASGEFPGDAFILNPDRVMQALPEYIADKDMTGAQAAYEKWEMPARELAYAMADQAMTMRAHIIKDMGCVRDENYRMLCRLKQSGYIVNMYYIECDMDTAISRVHQRDFRIADTQIRERYDSLQAILPEYRQMADNFYLHCAMADMQVV